MQSLAKRSQPAQSERFVGCDGGAQRDARCGWGRGTPPSAPLELSPGSCLLARHGHHSPPQPPRPHLLIPDIP